MNSKYETRITDRLDFKKFINFLGVGWLLLTLIFIGLAKDRAMAVSLPALHIVVRTITILLCGGLGYRALFWSAEGVLKKKHLPCRYCAG